MEGYTHVKLTFSQQRKANNISLQENQLVARRDVDSSYRSVETEQSFKLSDSGPNRILGEFMIGSSNKINSDVIIGIIKKNNGDDLNGDRYNQQNARMIYCSNGTLYHNGTNKPFFRKIARGSKVGVLVDFVEGSIQFRVNEESSQKHLDSVIQSSEWVFMVAIFYQNDSVSIINPTDSLKPTVVTFAPQTPNPFINFEKQFNAKLVKFNEQFLEILKIQNDSEAEQHEKIVRENFEKLLASMKLMRQASQALHEFEHQDSLN